jgi:hypothetical protein
MASPWPVTAPFACLILESALCPQITPGIAVNIVKQSRLKIPRTRLKMARPEVLGWAAFSNGGGVDSFMIFNWVSI